MPLTVFEFGVVVMIVGGVLLACLLIRWCEVTFDRRRIRQYLREMGGHLVSSTWAPFGPGWVRAQDARIYRIRYTDAQGSTHEACCRTGSFAGVYLTKDRTVPPA